MGELARRKGVMLWPAGYPLGLPQSKPGTARHGASALFFHQQAAYVNSPPPPRAASAGEVPYLIGSQPVQGYAACPGTGHQHSGGKARSPPPTHLGDPTFTLRFQCPVLQTPSPAPNEESVLERWADGQPPAHLLCAPSLPGMVRVGGKLASDRED